MNSYGFAITLAMLTTWCAENRQSSWTNLSPPAYGSETAQRFPVQSSFRLHFHSASWVWLALWVPKWALTVRLFEATTWEGGSCKTDRKPRNSIGSWEKATCEKAKPKLGTL